jgi:protein-S-isoprenylcysteine O-methyltransferase Ste14
MPPNRRALHIFAVASYTAFLVSFSYFGALVLGLVAPRASSSAVAALAIDAALLAFFGITHSFMARAPFKQWLSRIVAPEAGRSVYVMVASAQVALLVWQWRGVDGALIWHATGALATVLFIVQVCGFAIALLSTFLVDHFELFGLAQAFGRTKATSRFVTPLFYRLVRHPLYLGMLIALWCPPAMSIARLALTIGFTLYVLVGARLEERDLVRDFGDEYRAYQGRVPMLLPWRGARTSPGRSASS